MKTFRKQQQKKTITKKQKQTKKTNKKTYKTHALIFSSSFITQKANLQEAHQLITYPFLSTETQIYFEVRIVDLFIP